MPQPEQKLFLLLRLAAHRLQVEMDRRALRAAGITAAQAGVLFVVAQEPGIAQARLAEELAHQESAVTAMVRRLLAAGLVDRRASERDRRAFELYLTPAGEAALAELDPERRQLNRQIVEGLGLHRTRALAETLDALVALDLEPG